MDGTGECLMCGKECEGLFCGAECEQGGEAMRPVFDGAMRRLREVFAQMDRAEAATRGVRAPVIPTVEDMVREAMLEGMAWEAFREAKATGVWH